MGKFDLWVLFGEADPSNSCFEALHVLQVMGLLLFCGDPNFGVAWFKCCGCGTETGVPFSCKSRICPSCVKRKAEETAANLTERLPDVGHRHVVMTIPRKAGLRLRILQDPKLFWKIARIIVYFVHQSWCGDEANLLSCPTRRDTQANGPMPLQAGRPDRMARHGILGSALSARTQAATSHSP